MGNLVTNSRPPYALTLTPAGTIRALSALRGWDIRARLLSLLVVAPRDGDGWHYLAQREAAAALGIDYRHTWRAFHELLEAHVLEHLPGRGRRPSAYRVNGAVERWRGLSWSRPAHAVAAALQAAGEVERVVAGDVVVTPSRRRHKAPAPDPLRRLLDGVTTTRNTRCKPVDSAPLRRLLDGVTTARLSLSQALDATEGCAERAPSGERAKEPFALTGEQRAWFEAVHHAIRARVPGAMVKRGSRPWRTLEELARAGTLELGAALAALEAAPASYRVPLLVEVLELEVAAAPPLRVTSRPPANPKSVEGPGATIAPRDFVVLTSYRLPAESRPRAQHHTFTEAALAEAAATEFRSSSSWAPPGALELEVELL